jgi:peptidoglycan L-alanyl-D-glutamate endopeptidase CwlK
MAFKAGARSLKNLQGVHPKLVAVVHRALEIGLVDFAVICGVRTQAEQNALYAQGRTKPGKIVTWTRNSNHRVNPATGFGHAVDLFPGTWEIIDNKKTPEIDDAYALVNRAMMQAAKELGVKIRWGANWDGDKMIREKGETDNPHFELVL